MHVFRTQYPVGQGFFHAGSLHASGRFDYVYDCGARATYQRRLSSSIHQLVHRLPGPRAPKPGLDLLVLSHAHYDHLSGVPELLARTRCRVVLLPLLTVTDRVLAFAEALLSEVTIAAGVAELLADPIGYLRGQDVEWVIEVDPDFGPPESDGGDITPLPSNGDSGFRIEGPQRPGQDGRSTIIGPAGRLVVDVAEWVLVPYVDPAVVERQQAFLDAIRALADDSQVVDNAKEAIKWLQRLAATPNGRQRLQQAYKDAGLLDMNVTSLSLYSGPRDASLHATGEAVAGAVRARAVQVLAGSGRRNLSVRPWWISSRLGFDWRATCGWLGTGDADLRTPDRRDAFLRHYRDWLPVVSTFAVPHHGSRHNVDDELFKEPGFRPKLAVVGANPAGDYGHPHAETCQVFVKRRIPLLVVDQHLDSHLEEIIDIF